MTQQVGAERPIRWGILGTGGIASRFVADLQLVPDAAATAVGSRSTLSAEAFGARFGIPRRHGSYQELVADPEVDVVYVATPHPVHHPAALLAIEAGKSVLVEKPFTMDAAQADELIAAAAENGVFLMEAMWTRFLPHMQAIRERLAAGDLGELVTVIAEHSQWFLADPAHRLFDPELGGGALLDLGVYPLSFASWVLGAPAGVVALGARTRDGVDSQTSILLRYRSGAHAVLTSTLRAAGANRAAIIGTEGRIEIDSVWHAPTSFTFFPRTGEPQRVDAPAAGNGLRYEAIEVGRCLRAGLLESPVMPLAETRSVLATMDEIRRQIGVQYPYELAALQAAAAAAAAAAGADAETGADAEARTGSEAAPAEAPAGGSAGAAAEAATEAEPAVAPQ